MQVSQAIAQRMSVRAFLDKRPDAAVVQDILARAAQAPSGGNLQPWRVYALAGNALEGLKAKVAANPFGETPEYAVYPPELWDPFRSRRFKNGESLYAAIGIPREDRPARLAQLAKNGTFFGAPVGVFFCLDRKLGPPQWSDLGMYMQNVMLLAVENGLATCAQEYWAIYPKLVAETLGLPEDHMVFSGMALGYADQTAPINSWRSARDGFDTWGSLIGF